MARPVSFYSEGVKLAGDLFLPADLTPGREARRHRAVPRLYRRAKHLPAGQRARAQRRRLRRADLRLQGLGRQRGADDPAGAVQPRRRRAGGAELHGAQPEVDPERLGIYGTSYGGATVVFVAAIDPRVKCVVSVVGIGNGARWMRSVRRPDEYHDLLERAAADRAKRALTGKSEFVDRNECCCRTASRLNWRAAARRDNPAAVTQIPLEFVDDTLGFNPEWVVDNIAPRPMLFITTDNDRLVPPQESEAMYARAGEPKKLVMLKRFGHYEVYAGEALRQVMERDAGLVPRAPAGKMSERTVPLGPRASRPSGGQDARAPGRFDSADQRLSRRSCRRAARGTKSRQRTTSPGRRRGWLPGARRSGRSQRRRPDRHLLPLWRRAAASSSMADGHAWCQSLFDGYVGYIEARHLALGPAPAPTHFVATTGTYAYGAPDLRSPPADFLPRHSAVAVVETGLLTRGTEYARLDTGLHLPLACLSPEPPAPLTSWPPRRFTSAAPTCGAAEAFSASTARGWCRTPSAISASRYCATPTCSATRSAKAVAVRRRSGAAPRRPDIHPRPCDDLCRRRRR